MGSSVTLPGKVFLMARSEGRVSWVKVVENRGAVLSHTITERQRSFTRYLNQA